MTAVQPKAKPKRTIAPHLTAAEEIVDAGYLRADDAQIAELHALRCKLPLGPITQAQADSLIKSHRRRVKAVA
jgi:hypothetical protein